MKAKWEGLWGLPYTRTVLAVLLCTFGVAAYFSLRENTAGRNRVWAFSRRAREAPSIFAPAAVHGLVTKGNFSANTEGLIIWVNHKYKFVYVRETKTGSTSVVTYFKKCELKPNRLCCLEKLPEDTPRKELAALLSSYFVFAVVRNPYKRALSSYKFLLTKFRNKCLDDVTWDGFCAAPYLLADLCEERPACCMRGSGTRTYYENHVKPQNVFLPREYDDFDGTPLGEGEGGSGGGGSGSGTAGGPSPWVHGWGVDYIARTEHMNEDMAEVVAQIDARRDPSLPPLADLVKPEVAQKNAKPSCVDGGLEPEEWETPGGVTYLGGVPKEQYCDDEKYFSEEQHPGCLASLTRFYERDLRLLFGGVQMAGDGSSSSSTA